MDRFSRSAGGSYQHYYRGEKPEKQIMKEHKSDISKRRREYMKRDLETNMDEYKDGAYVSYKEGYTLMGSLYYVYPSDLLDDKAYEQYLDDNIIDELDELPEGVTFIDKEGEYHE